MLPIKSFQPLVIQNTEGYSLSERYGNPGKVDVVVGQDARDLTIVLTIVDRGAREDPDIGIEIVVGLARGLDVVAMADRLPADIARQGDTLGRVDDVPSGHRFVDGRILDKGAWRCLARHVEMDRIMRQPPALPHLGELDPLYLELEEALAEDRMRAEIIAAVCLAVGAERP